MTVIALHIPHFSLRVALLDQPELDGMPLVLTSAHASRRIVVDASPEAVSRGVRNGMLLREVSSFCPDAAFVAANPVHESMVFSRIMDNLERFSPVVEATEAGSCLIDLYGLDRHISSPAEAAQRVVKMAPAVLRPRAGVGPGRFVASAASRKAPPGGVVTVDPDEVLIFLKEIPVAWLPFSRKFLTSCDRLGLRTLGDLRTLPASAMASRFGPEGKEAWNLANGIDTARITPRKREITVTERLELAAPTTSRESLLIGIRQLVTRAFNRPELQHRYVRQVRVQIMMEEHRSWERELSFREALGPQQMATIVTHRLQTLELPGAAEQVVLHCLGLIPEQGRQEMLPGFQPRQNPSLAEAIHQLKQRYGQSPLYHIVEVEPWSRIPERRHALISYDP